MANNSARWLSPWSTRNARRKQRRRLRRLFERRALFEPLEARQLLASGQSATLAYPAAADVSLRPDQPGAGNFYVGQQPQEDAFLRFDVSSFRGDLSQARVRLVPAAVHGRPAPHTAYAVNDDSWSESRLTWTARPPRDSTPLASWTPEAGTPVEFDVTALVQQSLEAGDPLISISVVGAASESRVRYYSREHSDAGLRPELILTGSVQNSRPTAAADSYKSINGGTPLVVTAAHGLLANDTDADGDSLRLAGIVDPPDHGQLAWQADGSFTYTLTDPDYVGRDTFEYTVSDGISESRRATATIDVLQAMTLRLAAAARVAVHDIALGPQQQETFVRFDLSRVGRQVFQAKIRLSATADPTTVPKAYTVSDDSWQASGLDWGNRPTRDSSPLARRTGAGGSVEFDISSLVRSSLANGDKQISIAVVGAPEMGFTPEAEGESGDLELILTTANVITVDAVSDDDDASQNNFAHTTLREAIQLANQTPEAEVIAFALSGTNPVIELIDSRGQITISSDMYVLGPADGTTLTVRVAAGADMRAFNIAAATLVGVSDLLIEGGSLATGDGAAIYNAGDLTLERVTLSGNSAAGSGGAVYNASGALLTLNNATISGNTAGGDGGGVANAGTLNATNATITNNTAGAAGGGIHTTGTSNLENTIVAANTGDDDVNGTFNSLGHNLIGSGAGATGFAASGDQVGAPGAVIDPLLGPLQDNGGAAPTHQLLAGSPAIDAGENTSADDTDARGAPRVLDGPDPGDPNDAVATVDIGAFEFGALRVNVSDDVLDTTPLGDGRVDTDSGTPGDQISLRAAIQELNALAGLGNPQGGVSQGYLWFAPGVDIHLLGVQGTNDDTAASGDLDVFGDIAIQGRSTTRITAACDPMDPECDPANDLNDRLFHLLPGARLQLDTLMLDDGHATMDGSIDEGLGGAVLNDAGTLEIIGSVIGDSSQTSVGNTADRLGGGVYSRGGQLTISNTLVEGNTAYEGAGVYVESGDATIDNGTLLRMNTAAHRGAGLYFAGAALLVSDTQIDTNELNGTSEPGNDGAGLYLDSGTVTITAASRIHDNKGATRGMGIFNAATLTIEDASRVELHGDHTGSQSGAGIYNTAALTINDSFVDNNTTGTGDGAGIHNTDTGVVTISGGSVSGNYNDMGRGAGIYNAGSLQLDGTRIETNTAAIGDGGGIYNNNGPATLDGVLLRGNLTQSRGGAIFNYDLDSRLTITNTTIEANEAHFEGGGVWNQYGSVADTGSTFADNTTLESSPGTAPTPFDEECRIEVESSFLDDEETEQLETAGGGAAIYHRPELLCLGKLPALDMVLAAAVNDVQTIVYVDDLEPLDRLPLPQPIRVGAERMIVTAIDPFKQALTVVRPSPIAHSVSDPLQGVLSETQTQVPISDAEKLLGYTLPLDVHIGPETVTVTAIEDGVLSVLRGRSGTRAVSHAFPVAIWGLSGGLTVASSTFSGNAAATPPGAEEAARGGAIYNVASTSQRPTVIQNSTFFGNRAGDGAGIWTPSRGDSHNIIVENTVIAGLPGEEYPAEDVVGFFWSGGHNLIGADQVRTVGLVAAIDQYEMNLQLDEHVRLPSTPFKIRVSHEADGRTVHEEMLVTHADRDRLLVERGRDAARAVPHPSGAHITFSVSGFFRPGDKHGALEASYVTKVDAFDGIDEMTTSIPVLDASGFPEQLPLRVRVIHEQGTGVVYEDMLVTQVSLEGEMGIGGHELTVLRGQNGTQAVAHPDAALVTFTQRYRLEPLLGPLADHGGAAPTHAPLPGSPLLDRGTRPAAQVYTRLSEPLAAGTANTTLSVADADDFPSPPFAIRLGDEAMLVQSLSRSAKTLHVQRALHGTSAEAHAVDATVLYAYSARKTLLGADVTSDTADQLTVQPLPGLSAAPRFHVRIHQEEMLVTAVTDNLDGGGNVVSQTLHVVRGAHGTTPALEHRAGTHVLVLLGDEGFAGSSGGTTLSGLPAGYHVATQLQLSVDPADVYTQLAAYAWHDDTALHVADASVFPAAPFLLLVGDEWMQATAADTAANTVTVERAVLGSQPDEYEQGTTLIHGQAISANAADDTFLVADTSQLPPAPFIVVVDTELMRVTQVDSAADRITVERGAYGTLPEAHQVGRKLATGFDISARALMSVNPADQYTTLTQIIDFVFDETTTTAPLLASDPPVLSLADDLSQYQLPAGGSKLIGAMFWLKYDLEGGGNHWEVVWVSDVDVQYNTITVQRSDTFDIPAGATVNFQPTLHFADVSLIPDTARYLRLDDEMFAIGEVRDLARNAAAIYHRGFHSSAITHHAFGTRAIHGYPITDDVSDTTLNVADTSRLPSPPFMMWLGSEQLRVTAVDIATDTVTVERGAFGTQPGLHHAGVWPPQGTFLEVADATDFPKAPFTALIGGETMWVRSVDAAHNLVVVDRGSDGTGPLLHQPGTTITYGDAGVSPGFHGYRTRLAAPAGGTDTQLTVMALPTELPERFDFRLGDEHLRVTSAVANPDDTLTLTVVRGINGTPAGPHVAGADVLLLIDQRGALRYVDSQADLQPRIDIGAVEGQVFTVNTTADLTDALPGDGLIDTGTPLEVSLRAAVMEANALGGSATIVLPAGNFSLTLAGAGEDAAASGDLDVATRLTILGAGADATSIDAAGIDRVFDVLPGAALMLRGLTVTGGDAGSGAGGAVRIDQAQLTLDATAVDGNSAGGGAGIWSSQATVTITRSTLSANSALADGGGILALGSSVTITGSTLSGNSAAGNGGAIFADALSTLEIDSSTLAANSAASTGGVYNLGAAQVGNSILATNTASGPLDVFGDFASAGYNLLGAAQTPTELAADIGPSDTSLTVADPSSLPPAPLSILVDNLEEMLVTSIDGSTLTVVRAQGGHHGRQPYGVRRSPLRRLLAHR